MVRFRRQDEHYGCGPFSIYNYWRLMGFSVKYSDIKILKRLLGCNKKIGTKSYLMEEFLGSKFKKCQWKTLKHKLLSGYHGIFSHNNHFCLIIGVAIKDRRQYVITVNHYIGETVSLTAVKDFKNILKDGEVLLLKGNKNGKSFRP